MRRCTRTAILLRSIAAGARGRWAVRRFSLATILLAVGMVANADADQCGDLVARSTAAAAELNRYGAQAGATTSRAIALARDARRVIAQAEEACKRGAQEAALKVSAANIAGIEKALSDAKSERLRDTGIFPPPDGR